MSHLAFIAASYAVSLLGLGLLATWLLMDNATQKRALDELEARGIKRRSKASAPSASAPLTSAPMASAPQEGEGS